MRIAKLPTARSTVRTGQRANRELSVDLVSDQTLLRRVADEDCAQHSGTPNVTEAAVVRPAASTVMVPMAAQRLGHRSPGGGRVSSRPEEQRRLVDLRLDYWCQRCSRCNRPLPRAKAAASVRPLAPNLAKMLDTWTLTVFALM